MLISHRGFNLIVISRARSLLSGMSAFVRAFPYSVSKLCCLLMSLLVDKNGDSRYVRIRNVVFTIWAKIADFNSLVSEFHVFTPQFTITIFR